MPTSLLLNTSREERRPIYSSAFISADNPDPIPTTGYFLTSSQLLLIFPWSTYPQANSGIWVECQNPDFTIIVSVAMLKTQPWLPKYLMLISSPRMKKKNIHFLYTIMLHLNTGHPRFLQIHLNPSRILIIENMTSMNSSTVRRLAPTQRPTWPPISAKCNKKRQKKKNKIRI